MNKSIGPVFRGAAFLALAMATSAMTNGDAKAFASFGTLPQGAAPHAQPAPDQSALDQSAAFRSAPGQKSALAGAKAPIQLAGFKRSRSGFSKSRGFKKSRSFSRSRQFKGASSFSGPRRFNGARKFNAPRRFGSSIASDLLRRDRGFRGPRALTGRSAALVRGSRLNSRSLFRLRPNAFRRDPFGDSRIRALRAEALALDAEARLRELGLTPAQEAAKPAMSPALMRALALTKAAQAEAAAERAGTGEPAEGQNAPPN